MFIGLTGTLASGKGFVADFFKQKGFIYLSLSDELREYLKSEEIEITRENLIKYGNKLREKSGADALAQLIFEKIKNQEYKKVVIDSIRNPAEVQLFEKNLKNFFLIAIDAPTKTRFKRLVDRNRNEQEPLAWNEFAKKDKISNGVGQPDSGQQVLKCMKLAKFLIKNEGTKQDAIKKIEKLYEDLQKKIPRPTWDEYFIEIMNSVSKRATCDRGKSGCVIVKNKHILVTGYVGSPAGLPHCDEVGHQMKAIVHEDGKITNHCVRTAHAEQNAICQAAKLGIPLDGSTLYCRMTPCSTCAKMIINSGIKRVVCEKKYHAGKESEEIFKQAGVKLDMLSDETMKYKN